VELKALFTAGATPASLLPAWCALEGRVLPPIGPEIVVLFTVLGIVENFISFVDFLEFFLCTLFLFGNVGMVLPGQLSEGFLNILIASVPRTPRTL
jgi:hypothetical protein